MNITAKLLRVKKRFGGKFGHGFNTGPDLFLEGVVREYLCHKSKFVGFGS